MQILGGNSWQRVVSDSLICVENSNYKTHKNCKISDHKLLFISWILLWFVEFVDLFMVSVSPKKLWVCERLVKIPGDWH